MKTGMIFIDGSNVFYDWKTVPTVFESKLDIEKYIELLKSKFSKLEIKRTYYFGTKTDDNSSFLRKINSIPYCEVKQGRLQSKSINLDRYFSHCDGCKNFKRTIETKIDKGTDVNIAVEILRHAYNNGYDVAILVSRDADFSSVVKIVKDFGKTVELVLFDSVKNFAKELSETVDNITTISEEECLLCIMSEVDSK